MARFKPLNHNRKAKRLVVGLLTLCVCKHNTNNFGGVGDLCKFWMYTKWVYMLSIFM